MKAIEKISQELLDNLQSPYIKSITLGDEDGADIATDKSEQARKFAFNFVVDSVILGTVLVTLNADTKSLEVKFDHDMLKKVNQDYPELKPRAKKAWFERNKRKMETVKKYAALRAELKAKRDYAGLAKLPRDASPVRLVNRCSISCWRSAL